MHQFLKILSKSSLAKAVGYKLTTLPRQQATFCTKDLSNFGCYNISTSLRTAVGTYGSKHSLIYRALSFSCVHVTATSPIAQQALLQT